MSEELQQHVRSRTAEWEFLQVVRALERFSRAEAEARRRADHAARAQESAGPAARVPPTIRYRTSPSMGFPESEVESVVARDEEVRGRREVARVWDVSVNFIGLNGSCGVMPRSDVGDALQQAGSPNNRALLGLFDLVGAPFIALFAEAMRKYRAPLQWERHAVREGKDRPAADRLEAALLARTGCGDPELLRSQGTRFQVRQLLRLGAAFAAPHRTAAGLASALEALLEVPVTVRSFQPFWRAIPDEDCTRLGTEFSRLGRNAIIGTRFCDVEAGVELVVGPVDFPLFLALLPSGSLHAKLADLVAMYAGHHLRVRLRPVLRREQVPGSRLGGPQDGTVSLGRSSWLAARSREQDYSGTVVPLSAFDGEGLRV